MPVPKRKVSKARQGSVQANKGIRPKAFTACANAACGKPLATHTVCRECGYYKGVKVLVTKAERGLKRADVRKVKAAKTQEQQPTQE